MIDFGYCPTPNAVTQLLNVRHLLYAGVSTNYVLLSPVLLSLLKSVMNQCPIWTKNVHFAINVLIIDLKLQDTFRQIVEIKYRKFIDNVGPDFLMRHELLAPSLLPASIAATHSSAPLSQHVSFSKTSSLVSDWPCGPEAWDPVVLFPVVTGLKTRAKSDLSHPAPIHQPFGIFLPDDTYHESSHVPSHVALSRNSSFC